MYNCFRPGKFWYDNNGKLIQAHGGAIIYAENKYWWYGENKEGVTGFATGESCGIRQHGWKLYSSEDLYNWQDEGFLFPESEDPDNIFHASKIGDRPHVLYNKKTKTYVLWIKVGKTMDFTKCMFAVCVGKTLKSMKFLKMIVPTPHRAGDFDLFEMDGKGYIIFENPHTNMVCRELTDDYTDLAETYSEHLFLGTPPFIREAPAFFERNGRKFLLTSGTTSYFANPSITYDITDIHGEWKDLGETCVNDVHRNSFHAQYSYIFKHPKIEDLYIAMGDRWLLDVPVDMPNAEELFKALYGTGGNKALQQYPMRICTDRNTSLATYVWLPITFTENGTPKLIWQTEWKIEEE